VALGITDIVAGILDEPTRLAPFVAAISAMATVGALSRPVLEGHRRRARLRDAVQSEQSLRKKAAAAREKGAQDAVIALRHAAPKKLYKAIVDRLNLGRLISDPKTQTLIHQAGFRSPAAVIKITAMRVIVAACLATAAGLYSSVIVFSAKPPALHALVAVAGAAAGWQAPILFLRNRVQKRRTDIRRNWPDAMDLLLICVESGMSIEAAFRKVAEEVAVQSVTLGEELSLTTAELAYLQDRTKAFRRLATRTEVEVVNAIVTSLIQAEKYGTPIGQALRVLSRESRDLRMAEAERKAAALPPKLTVPMIIFFLPVLFAVIMTPAIIQILEN
jgi:tight adherence protein C